MNNKIYLVILDIIISALMLLRKRLDGKDLTKHDLTMLNLSSASMKLYVEYPDNIKQKEMV